jgi:alanine or glycine:cation symporter, AGCS family
VNIIELFNLVVLDYFFVISFLLAGLYFTVRLGFVQIRYFGQMIRFLLENNKDGQSNNHREGLSSLQAFIISVASRLGTGNLIGVSVAISIGGAGAAFWMWMMAFLGMATALVESSLAQLYKQRTDDGLFVGGPSYYIKEGLQNPILSKLFVIALLSVVFILGSMMQVNAVAAESYDAFGIPKWLVGVLMILVVFVILLGGVRRISVVSNIAVPIIATSYLGFAAFLMIKHAVILPSVVAGIFSEALNVQSAAAGGLGTVIAMGVRRGLMSNEAGLGTAPAAAATAFSSHPVKQGLVQSFSVFVDTFLVCNATVMIILLAPAIDVNSLGSSSLLAYALSYHLGALAKPVLAITILVLAFTTLITFVYYGESCILSISKKKYVLRIYQIAIFGSIYMGAVVEATLAWQLVDYSLVFTALLHLYAILKLFPQVESMVADFKMQYKSDKDAKLRLSNSIYKKHAFSSMEYWIEQDK